MYRNHSYLEIKYIQLNRLYIFQYGSHVIDLLKYLTNQKAARIHGIVKTIQKTTSKVRGIRQITADDVASLNFETENNILRSQILLMNLLWVTFVGMEIQ